jgi:RimJ/RimL family protein N-acetyltransferase
MRIRLRPPGPAVRLETARFVLSTAGRWAGARISYPWTADPEIMAPLGQELEWTFRRWFRRFGRPDNRKSFCFLICPRASASVIGMERVVIDRHGNATLSVIIGDRSWWGKGVVAEARQAVIDYCFDKLGCARVVGQTIATNYPSIANYQILGFHADGVMRKIWRNATGDGRHDLIVFSLLAEEWRARAAGGSR